MYKKHLFATVALSFLTSSLIHAEEAPFVNKTIEKQQAPQLIGKPGAANQYPGVGWKPQPGQIKTDVEYPGVGWKPTAKQDAPNLSTPNLNTSKPLVGNIVLQPSMMNNLGLMTVNTADLKKTWDQVQAKHKKAYRLILNEEMCTNSSIDLPTGSNAAGIFGNNAPKDLFEALDKAFTCTNKNYTIADQQTAGCVASETLALCQKKLIDHCVEETHKQHGTIKAGGSTRDELKALSDAALKLREQISIALKPKYQGQ